MKEGEKTEHPAHALLQFCRVNGEPGPLFGSSVSCHSTIRLRIAKAATEFSLGRHSHYARDSIIEVEMSPVQFAEAITTLNAGSGVPCTVRYLLEEKVPDPVSVDIPDIHKKTFNQRTRDFLESLLKQEASIKEILEKKSISKADRETVSDFIAGIRREIGSNMGFYVGQFNEAVEKMVTEAKGEIDAFLLHTVVERGLEAIRSEAPRIAE